MTKIALIIGLSVQDGLYLAELLLSKGYEAHGIKRRSSLFKTVMGVVGFEGEIVFDASKPDGTSRKLLNVDLLLALGWQSETSLRDGTAKAYADFLTKAVA